MLGGRASDSSSACSGIDFVGGMEGGGDPMAIGSGRRERGISWSWKICLEAKNSTTTVRPSAAAIEVLLFRRCLRRGGASISKPSCSTGDSHL